MSNHMSKDEREAFLAGLHVGIFSIHEEGHGPLSAPIWYAYEPGGDIVLSMGAESRKARLLKQTGRASLVAQQEAPPYKYVSVEGPVSIEPASYDVIRDLAIRYLGERGGEGYLTATNARQNTSSNLVVRLKPERWLTVDYGKGV